jgi:hypothetical protein
MADVGPCRHPNALPGLEAHVAILASISPGRRTPFSVRTVSTEKSQRS